MTESRRDQDPISTIPDLLAADFSDPTQDEQILEAMQSGSALSDFISRLRPVEDIEARLASDESHELTERLNRGLSPAPITNSFKAFIVDKVRQAHAYRTVVNDDVSPARLRLNIDHPGLGIFDPEEAPAIESEVLQRFLSTSIETCVFVPQAADGTEEKEIVINPTKLQATLDHVKAWRMDYQATYGHDALADVNLTDLRSFAPRIPIVEDGGIPEVFQQIEAIRQRDKAGHESAGRRGTKRFTKLVQSLGGLARRFKGF